MMLRITTRPDIFVPISHFWAHGVHGIKFFEEDGGFLCVSACTISPCTVDLRPFVQNKRLGTKMQARGSWSFGIPKGGENFPPQNFPRRNSPRTKSPPPPCIGRPEFVLFRL